MIEKTIGEESSLMKVEAWLRVFSGEGKVGQIDSLVLREVLEESGADFSQKEKLHSLSEYTNKKKADGLREVWGEKFNSYKRWTKEYVEEYEETTQKSLPELKPSGIKNSGMLQFLGELTAYAAGEMSFDDYKRYTEARYQNGKCWSEDKKGERIRIDVPTSEIPKLLSSFPPEFPKAAFDWIKNN